MPDPLLSPLELIGHRYRVVAPLGTGAMGAVYHAVDTQHDDRDVAIKVLQAAGEPSCEQRLRFKEEFRAMTRLRHPNTVEVYDFGELAGARRYLAMELVPGQDLGELAVGGAIALPAAYALLSQLLQALHFIHARGYLHRDIKSPNVRVRPDGALKLIDFGLMTLAGVPADGKLAGTPGTMAPELVRGQAPTPTSDLYAVGCVAYELLTGQLPYVGSVREVLLGHRDREAPALRLKRPDAPARLAALVASLLAKDPARRPADARDVLDELAKLAGVPLARESVEQKTSYLHTGTLVGREAELAALAAGLAAARLGQGQAFYLDGPAGVGKSRLARELLTSAKLDDLLVCEGACLERVLTPYKALSHALRPALARLSAARLAELAPALAPVFPELGAGEPDGPVRQAALHAALEALVREAAAVSPVVLSLDDLHWANPATLAGFTHLARALADAPVLCLATLRGDEVAGSSALWSPVAEGAVVRMRLAPFGLEASRGLVRAMLRDVELTPEHGRALYDATGGNAFFLTEVLRYLIERGSLTHHDGAWRFPPEAHDLALPPGLGELICRRLEGLSHSARELVQAAAVGGRYLHRDMLCTVAELSSEDLFERLDELAAKQFIVKEGHRYSFGHDRLREIVYSRTPLAERQRLHQRAGEYLEAGSQQPTGALVNRLAHHFAHGTDRLKAFTYLEAAGTRAQAAGFGTLALGRWLHAATLAAELGLPDARRAQLALKLAETGFSAAPQAAIDALEPLLPLLSAADGERARALLATAHGFAGRPLAGIAAAEAALAAAPSPYLATSLAWNHFLAGHFDLAVAHAAPGGSRLAAEVPGSLAAFVRVGDCVLANARAYQGFAPSDDVRDAALTLAMRAHSQPLEILALHFHALHAVWTGRAREAWPALEAMATRARGHAEPSIAYLRCCLFARAGELAEAEAALEDARHALATAPRDLPRQLLDVLWAESLAARQHPEEAEAALAACEGEARQSGSGLVLLQALIARARLALARGDRGLARERLLEARARASAGACRNPLHEAIALRALAELALASGAPAEARTHLEAALAIVSAPEQDNPYEQGHLQLVLGRALHAADEPTLAAGAFTRAGEAFEAIHNAHGLHLATLALEALARAPQADAGLDVQKRWLLARALPL